MSISSSLDACAFPCRVQHLTIDADDCSTGTAIGRNSRGEIRVVWDDSSGNWYDLIDPADLEVLADVPS